MEQLTGVDAAFDELCMRRLDVRDDEMQPVERARRRLRVLHDRDRAGGSGRNGLDDAEVLAGAMVDEEEETDLVEVERLGAVNVGHRDDDEFEGPVHARALLLLTGDLAARL